MQKIREGINRMTEQGHHADLTGRLIDLLRVQIGHHDQLERLLEEKRSAIARADGFAIEAISRREHAFVQSGAEIEKQRLVIVGDLTRIMDPSRTEPFRLRALAERIDGPQGDELNVLAEQLRARIRAVQGLNDVLRKATDSLGAHLAGVMQIVQGALSQARVYSRSGRVDPGTPLATSLDVSS